jgi:hypothetical protein
MFYSTLPFQSAFLPDAYLDSRASTVSSPRPNQPNKKSDIVSAPTVPSSRSKPSEVAVPKQTTKTAEPANETIIPQQSLQSQIDAAKEFGELFYKLIEEATDLAALKTQKGAAEKEFNRRDNDFNKTKGNHEKFPATEEVLKRSKESAKKALLSIGEKCKEKDTMLKDIVVQGTARILPRLLGSGGQDRSLRLQVDSLEKRCQEIECQVRDQRSFIEDQRLARESLDEKYKVLLEKTSGYDKNIEDIKRESVKTTRTVSELSDRIPEDLKPKLDSLLTCIDQLEAANAGKAKEEPMSIAISKALADSNKTLEDYGHKLQTLDTYVRGNGTKPGLTSHISSLVGEQSAFREELNKAHLNWTSVVERVAAVENQASRLDTVEKKCANIPSNVELVDFRKRISILESQSNGAIVDLAEVGSQLNEAKKRLDVVERQPLSDTSTVEKKLLAEVERLAGLEDRLNVLEMQSHPDTSTATEKQSLTEVERLMSLEKQISIVEKARSPTTMSTIATPAVDLEALKQECIAVVADMQSASDLLIGGDIDTLKATVKNIQADMDTRQANFYAPLSALPAKFDALSQSVTENVQAHANYLKQVDTKHSNWAFGQQNIQQVFDNRIEAVEIGITNLDKRMDLLNTKDMAIYILDQMDSTYPSLRDAQNSLVEHKTSLQRADARFIDIEGSIEALNSQILTLEGLVQQNPADTQANQALRKEVDDLNGRVNTADRLAREAKDAIDALSKKSVDDAKIYGDKFGDICYDLEELKEQHTALATKVSPSKAATMFPAVENPNIPASPNSSMTNNRGRVSLRRQLESFKRGGQLLTC